MKKQYKKILYGIGLLALTFVFVACSSEPIAIGETAPAGLFDILLVYPISWLLDTLFKATNSGALAITITTLTICLITAPLDIYSQVSMKKQQEIQPQLKALQDKYPNNRTDSVQQQKYMQEYQQLVTQNGASMLGMCLPMLLLMFVQLPILSAMFSAVRRLTILNNASFELFGVVYHYGQSDPGLTYIPYIGSWIRIFIFGAMLSMFISQYFSLPKDQRNPKESQQAMSMYIMNVMMLFVFWSSPVALAIYWIVSSLVRLLLRFTVVNNIVKAQHEKFKEKQRAEKAKRYK